MVCTAGSAPGDWRSFRLRERNMLEAQDGAGRVLWDVRPQSELLEVRDECSFSDLADGLGYSSYSC